MSEELKTNVVSLPDNTNRTIMYIGPTLVQPGLTQHQNYINGYPQSIKDLVQQAPYLKDLFIPLDKMNTSFELLKKKGSRLETLYAKAKSEFDKKEAEYAKAKVKLS